MQPEGDNNSNGVGTLKEMSLHAALKEWYARPGDRLEVPVDGYIVDIVRDDLLIEIQTSNFSALKRKLRALTESHRVRLVHPIAREKWLLKLSADRQTRLERRKSPKRGRLAHIFAELVRIPTLIESANFSLEVLLIQEEEVRCNDGKGSWRRKGWSIIDHRLLDVIESVRFDEPADFARFLANELPAAFTTKELAKSIGCRRRIAQQAAYCLRKMDVIEKIGKRGNAYLYEITEGVQG
jgi:hypothetical protein